jgi:hypothetical protein
MSTAHLTALDSQWKYALHYNCIIISIWWSMRDNSKYHNTIFICTCRLWVNWQRNPRFVEKRLLIVTIQSHCLIFLISFFKVKNLCRIMETPRICKKLIHLKAIIWLAISRQSTGLISVFKKSHEYEDSSASWPTGDKWWVNQGVIGCGLKLHEVN